MKKYLLAIAWLIIVAPLYSQTVIMSQNFQGSTSGWNTKDNNGSGVVWVYQYNNIELGTPPNNVPFSFIDSNQTNRFAVANAANATTTINTDLNSPAIDCSGHNGVLLEFLQWYFVYQDASDGIVQVSTDQTNWTTVYDALESSGQTDPELVDIDISAYAANQSKVYLKFNYSTSNGELWWVIDNVKVMDYAVNDIAVTSVTQAPITGITNHYQVNCTIQNKGSASVSDVTLSYTINGSRPVAEELTNFSLGPFETVNYSFQTTAQVRQPGVYPVLVYSSLPNGVNDDNTTNDSISTSVMFLGTVPEKNVLIEEYTTSPCGYCPGGAYNLAQALNAVPNTIPVALHTGFDPADDPMSTASIISFGEYFVQGAPEAAIDRIFFPNNDLLAIGVPNLFSFTSLSQLQQNDPWLNGTLESHAQVSPVGIVASNQYDSATRQVQLSVFTTFYGPMTGDFRVSCYVIEDSIIGTQESYYYESPSNTSVNPYYQKGTLVNQNPPVALIPGYVYNFVVRDFIGSPWGWGTPSFGNGITTPVVDSQYTQAFTYTLSGNWNPKHVSLVVFVNEFNNSLTSGKSQVFNAVKMPLNNLAQNDVDQIVLTAVDEVPASTDKVSLSPNPATNQAYINYSIEEPGRIGFEIYNSLGQVVITLHESDLGAGKYTAMVNTESFANGVYFLAMKRNNAPYQTIKFVVSR